MAKILFLLVGCIFLTLGTSHAQRLRWTYEIESEAGNPVFMESAYTPLVGPRGDSFFQFQEALPSGGYSRPTGVWLSSLGREIAVFNFPEGESVLGVVYISSIRLVLVFWDGSGYRIKTFLKRGQAVVVTSNIELEASDVVSPILIGDGQQADPTGFFVIENGNPSKLILKRYSNF